MKLIVNHKWVAAASILIVLSLTYLLTTKKDINGQQELVKDKPAKTVTENPIIPDAKDAVKIDFAKTEVKPSKKRYKKQVYDINMAEVYQQLTDSSSVSTRLAAILNIQRSSAISYDTIDKLTSTLNNDVNSNVRLAALNLMSRYAKDGYVGNALMTSLPNQKDPLLQLSLIQLLGQTDNPKLDQNLYALANDPTTFAEVRDQAYLVLLNQNKL